MEVIRLRRLRRIRKLPYFFSFGVLLGTSNSRELRRKTRHSKWFEDTVLEEFEDLDWQENFRMRQEIFTFICDRLEEELSPQRNTVEEPLSVQKKVAIAIYWLASTSEYRTVANLFGVGKTTVCVCVHQVCTAIMNILLNQFVKFPEDNALKEVVKGFEDRWNFPNCAGAIDGSHIPIIAPQNSRGDYLNRKGFYSLILQGVCDHNYIFTDMNIGWPGRVHDARVFANSELYILGDTGALLPNWVKRVGDSQMPLVLLGDAAYPLKTWLLKPYTRRDNLTACQTTFNYRLNRARMTIENSFGRLKGRWRCLQKRLDVDVDFACTVIGCCVVLQNICESFREEFREDRNVDQGDDEDDGQDIQDGGEEVINCAKALRDEIAQAFSENRL